ncbi:MAG: hypothetical protein J6Y02_08815 [Pseudobutyrivibrio sp.]|nr:hypothetical protein [Pseudobutyrivibrio sp.]
MGTFYDAPNDYRSYLQHHGVKGMKWGVRHDKPSSGKKRKKGSNKNIDKEDLLLKYDYKKFKEGDKHLSDVAALGLAALNKRIYKDDISNPNDKNEQMWFLFEDQTQLMPAVADLALKGYSKDQIINTLDKRYSAAKKRDEIDPDGYYNDTERFYLNEFYGYGKNRIDKFVEDCVSVVDERKLS